MGRSKLAELAKKKNQEKQSNPDSERFWKELCDRIKAKQVIPIISNSFRTNRIFDVDTDEDLGIAKDGAKATEPDSHTIEEEVAMAWAEQIGYPLPECHKLARVAQYNSVNSLDTLEAKKSYLAFLKELLLLIADEDGEVDSERVEAFREEFDESSFSDIAVGLGYPRIKNGHLDPLFTLAKLQLPIYITTGYFDFLERALKEVGSTPRTQICFWSGQPVEFEDDENHPHQVDPDFVPTPEEPLVYHLYGFEKYPKSLVLSEDDYLDFLAKVSQYPNEEERIIPLYIQKALTQSSLLLLGYRLQDWDFRILFRGIINARHNSLQQFNLAIQLNPKEQKGLVPNDTVRDYLTKYFGNTFIIEWRDNDDFIKKLWTEWEKWR